MTSYSYATTSAHNNYCIVMIELCWSAAVCKACLQVSSCCSRWGMGVS